MTIKRDRVKQIIEEEIQKMAAQTLSEEAPKYSRERNEAWSAVEGVISLMFDEAMEKCKLVYPDSQAWAEKVGHDFKAAHEALQRIKRTISGDQEGEV